MRAFKHLSQTTTDFADGLVPLFLSHTGGRFTSILKLYFRKDLRQFFSATLSYGKTAFHHKKTGVTFPISLRKRRPSITFHIALIWLPLLTYFFFEMLVKRSLNNLQYTLYLRKTCLKTV